MSKAWKYLQEFVGWCAFLAVCLFVFFAVYLPCKILEDKCD